MSIPPERFWELDVLRGLAVLAMIFFHLFFFLNYFAFIEIAYWQGAWKIFARLIQWSFFLLVGIGLHLSYQHNVSFGRPFSCYLKKIIRRSFIVFAAAMVVTLFTGIFFPGDTIYFGVLHFIAVNIFLVGLLVSPYPLIAPIIASLIYAASFVINETTTDVFFLMPFGFQLMNFRTFDYFPIFPWMAIPILGVFLGSMLYPKAISKFHMPLLGKKRIIQQVIFLGRHALIMYLIHVPIIVLLIWGTKQLFFI